MARGQLLYKIFNLVYLTIFVVLRAGLRCVWCLLSVDGRRQGEGPRGGPSRRGLQAEHLAPRPGYLALAVDGATPQSRFGRLHRRRHSGTVAYRVVGGFVPLWDSNRVPAHFKCCTNHSATIPTM